MEKEEGNYLEDFTDEDLIDRLIIDSKIRESHDMSMKHLKKPILSKKGVIAYNWYIRRAKKEILKRIKSNKININNK